MIASAEELVGKTLVFALAQLPHEAARGERIASLAPLMILDTGEMIPFSRSLFPVDGYVFWWNVPSDDWHPGELVVGKLDRSTKHGEDRQLWYQMSKSEGKRTHREVFEFIRTSASGYEGYRWLVDGRKRIVLAHEPSSQFFVCARDELIGPFEPDQRKESLMGLSFICEPTDHANAIVHCYAGDDVTTITNDDSRFAEVTLSRSDSAPGKHGSDEFVRQYRLIRTAELSRDGCTSTEMTLLPESLLISRICKRITGRANRRDMHDRLEKLVVELNAEDRANENDLFDGLEAILRRATLSDAVTERLVQALITDSKLQPEIEKDIAQHVHEEAKKRGPEIEQEAREQAGEALQLVDELQNEIEGLEKTRDKLNSGIIKLKKTRAQEESRISAIIDSANQKLTEGRQELLAELSLLGPLLQSRPSDNSSATVQTELTAAYPESDAESVEPQGEPLDEISFARDRLPQTLLYYGCEIRDAHSELFHALIVACPLIGIPHLGWAAAYGEAMGGSAVLIPIPVEPDWISFHDVDNGPIGRAWRQSLSNPNRLFLITLDGIDRSPSHAWFRPWINMVAGWSKTLPGDNALVWPENLRLLVTEENSEACFALPDDIQNWIVQFKSETEGGPIDLDITNKNQGYFPFDAWRLGASKERGDAHDALCKEIELNLCSKFAPMRRGLAERLYSVLVRLGTEEDRIPRAIRWLLHDWTTMSEERT